MRTITISDRCLLDLDESNPFTPAVVRIGKHASTYDVAVGCGAVGDDPEIALTPTEINKLESLIDRVSSVTEIARKDYKE